MKKIAKEDQHKFLHKRLMELIQSEDAMEGIMAFREKREPKWQGK